MATRLCCCSVFGADSRMEFIAGNRDRVVYVKVVAFWVLLLGVGCAQDLPIKVYRVWPGPPAKPKIALHRIIRSADDLTKPGVLESIGSVLVGKKRPPLVRPQAVAVEADKYLYVADRKLRGVHVFGLRSSKGLFVDRVGDLPLVCPVGVAACGDSFAVSDSSLRKVFLLTPKGRLVRTFGKDGGFERPTGLAFDAKEELLYVTDTIANEVCVFGLDGQLVRRFGSRGDGPGQFNFPTHVFVAENRTIYVTDSLNFRVQAFDHTGQFLFSVGKHGDASGHLGVPKGVAVDRTGNIYIVDSYLDTVQIFDSRGRFLLGFGEPGSGPGNFQVPTGVTIDSAGRIFVCDSHNNRIQVFQNIGGQEDEHKASDR